MQKRITSDVHMCPEAIYYIFTMNFNQTLFLYVNLYLDFKWKCFL